MKFKYTQDELRLVKLEKVYKLRNKDKEVAYSLIKHFLKHHEWTPRQVILANDVIRRNNIKK